MSDALAAPVSAERTASPLKMRLCVMMFLQYFVQGSYLPIISVYLQDALGFSADQIGVFGSALAVGPLVAPFLIGQLVDRHVATERVLAFCHLAGGVIMLALYGQQFAAFSESTRFWFVVSLGTVYSTLYVPSLMLTNSLTFYHLKDRDREFPLVRLWGTIGFVLPAWSIEPYLNWQFPPEQLDTARGLALGLAGVSGLVMGVYSFSLPHTPPDRNKIADFAPAKVAGLMRHRHFFVLVAVSMMIAVVHKFYFVWNSPYLKMVLAQGGVTGVWEQRISSIGQISEVAVMAGLGFSILRLGFKRTMLIGAFAYFLRCLIFAFAVTMDGPFALVMTLVGFGQALHGFCFGCFLAAAFMYVDRTTPKDVRGSAQNLYGTFILGLGFFLGGFIAGRVGALFTTPAGISSLREQWGFAFQAGLITFTEKQGGEEIAMIRDWPGIWLGGGALALISLFGFWLLFPKDAPDEAFAHRTSEQG